MDHVYGSAEPQAVAGPSGISRKRKLSCSSSNTTSSSSSRSSSPKRGKRSRRARRKKTKRSNPMLDKLIKEVGELRQLCLANQTACHDGVSICSGVSGELYAQHNIDEESPDVEGQNLTNLDFTFEIETKLKEPSVPKTPDKFMKMLIDVQRLGSTAWSEVRYSDTQKLYSHSPGFVDLETNEEVKTYDTLRHLALADKSYAAITFCILKQKESLQEAIRNLLFWAKNTEVNFDNLSCKVEELFQKGELHKISSDLLQLVCGHRAESIEMRRETITSQIRDPLVKASLNKIPPSSTCLFNPESFTAALEKAGGVRKAFWPSKTGQTRSNQCNRRPSRGQSVHRPVVSSRETQYFCREPGLPTHMHACDNSPSRGGYFRSNYTNKAQINSRSSFQSDQYNNRRGSFHNRGSRPDRGSNRGRGHSDVPKGSRANQKHYKQ